MSDPDTQLIEFVLGILDQDAREAVERARRVSCETAAELDALEDALSWVALAADPVPPSTQVRTRLMASLEPSTRFAGFVERLARFFDLGVDRTRSLLEAVDAQPGSPWVPSGVPGTSFLHLDGGPRVATADCGLVHVAPGGGFPAHRHGGDEWVLVLQGRAQEDSGRIWEPGDLVHREAGSTHAFRVLSEVPFVFAVVLYGGIEIVAE